MQVFTYRIVPLTPGLSPPSVSTQRLAGVLKHTPSQASRVQSIPSSHWSSVVQERPELEEEELTVQREVVPYVQWLLTQAAGKQLFDRHCVTSVQQPYMP